MQAVCVASNQRLRDVTEATLGRLNRGLFTERYIS